MKYENEQVQSHIWGMYSIYSIWLNILTFYSHKAQGEDIFLLDQHHIPSEFFQIFGTTS
jgi:hypothetical protein